MRPLLPKLSNALRIVTALFVILLFSQCNSMRVVTMNAMQPAEVTFPSYIKTILVVDRTKFEKTALDVIEGAITGELPGEDKAGLQQVMTSFQKSVQLSPRFLVKRATESLPGNSVTSAFPDQLSWEKVNELCKKYKTESIVAIEIFDTDFIITNGERKVKQQVEENGTSKEVETNEIYATGVANIKIGFRIYNPTEMTIIDQELISRTNTWEATGANVIDAVAHLLAKQEATRYISSLAGASYGHKITPTPVKISREFYSKSKSNLEISAGARKADVDDWSDAISIWESGLVTANRKDAGYLTYNIAVAYEVLGELDMARTFAGQAYTDYGNKKAREYSIMLRNRMSNETLVQKQMED